MKSTLTYIKPATKANDGINGFIYLHNFGTGYQQLIFTTHEEATLFLLKQLEK